MSVNQSLWHVSCKMNNLVQNKMASVGTIAVYQMPVNVLIYSSREVTSGTVSALSRIHLLFLKAR